MEADQVNHCLVRWMVLSSQPGCLLPHEEDIYVRSLGQLLQPMALGLAHDRCCINSGG